MPHLSTQNVLISFCSLLTTDSEFVGKPLLARHRKVHEVRRALQNRVRSLNIDIIFIIVQILAVEMKDIHALTLKTITPDKWAGEATAAAESSADQAGAP